MSDYNIEQHYKEINSNNYLSNCYRHLTKSKVIHFLFLLIEILINLFQELDTFLRDFKPGNEEQKPNKISFISSITEIFKKIPELLKLSIMILFVMIFDLIYLFLQRKNFLKNYIYISIIINILELLYFRIFVLIFFNLIFSLTKIYLIVSLIIFLPHVFLIINNFLYNHLYFFVPIFIDHPFDEFSSIFDIILFSSKIFLAIAGTTGNEQIGKLCFLILLIIQIFFSFYLINKLINHSYLFMKNTFINKTRLCFFLSQTIIIIFALLVGKNEIETYLFIIICFVLLLIIMGFFYFMYNPYLFIKINAEKPEENVIYYLYILSDKNSLDFLFENKVNIHYEKCGVCKLCKKYNFYFNKNENEENSNLINEDKSEFINDNYSKNQLIDLFYIIYDEKIKYFHLAKNIVLNYKHKGKEAFNNNNHYYINLSFLMYSDFRNNNITLALNEKLLLEMINLENNTSLDNHKIQIDQLLLCNEFINLSNEVIKDLRNILNSEQNLNKAKKLVDLSFKLKDMKSKKYKKSIFGHKLENISNSKNIILACSIIYEEIFNTAINNSQIPIRENTQPLEDVFNNNSNKNDKIISLAFYLDNKNCKIIRVGRGMSSNLNNNLFDLFPLIFQQYQINLFLSTILYNFDNTVIKENKEKFRNSTFNNSFILKRKIGRKNVRSSLLNMKTLKPVNNNNKNKNKKEYIEIKLVLCENIDSKIYYRLITLKLTVLFNNDNNCFILLDGLYYIHKYSVITLIDYEKNKHANEKIFAVSLPELEKNTEEYSIPLKKFILLQNNLGYLMSKVSSFKISFKFFTIYLLLPKDKEMRKKIERRMSFLNETKILTNEEEKEIQNILTKKISKIILEDNSSMTSQKTSNSNERGLSNLGMRNKKRDNFYEYSGFIKIQKSIYLSIIIIVLAIIGEYIHLYALENDTKNNYNSFLEYREFYKLYFQLFSTIISLSCIQIESSNCKNLISYYTEQYFSKYPEESFDVNSFLLMQSELLAKNMMDKRTYMNDVHRFMGDKKYNEIFGRRISYFRISQSFTNNDIIYNLIQVEIQFSEAILIMCNSFKLLTNSNETKALIYPLNKTITPFSFINDMENEKELTTYKKEFYEMILNYKIYSEEFDLINSNLKLILIKKSNLIQLCILIYVNLDGLLILTISILIYLYISCFENIIIRLINFINKTTNTKNDDFIFEDIFTKKLDNLETILQIYNGDVLKSLKNLNIIYNDYQQYITKKNKNEAMLMAKRTYKKFSEEENKKKELFNVPKNQQIINKKEIRSFKFIKNYLYIFYIILIITIIICFYLNILWNDYFTKKKNLYVLMEKNSNIETSIYRSINIYNLIIFNNFTLEEITQNIYPNIGKKEESLSIIKSFYDDLLLAFNNRKEKSEIKSLYQDIDDNSSFTCENLFEINKNYIEELYNITIDKPKPDNLKERLIKICNNLEVADSNDPITSFERHFQYIKNGLIDIDNFTYDGLITHLKTGIFGGITFFFNTILIYLLEILFFNPHHSAVTKLLGLLNDCIQITEITLIIIDITFTFIILFVFISNIKNYCEQILLLNKTFKIYEIQEQ